MKSREMNPKSRGHPMLSKQGGIGLHKLGRMGAWHCGEPLACSAVPVFVLVMASSPGHHWVLRLVRIISASQVNNVIFHCLLLKMHSKKAKA